VFCKTNRSKGRLTSVDIRAKYAAVEGENTSLFPIKNSFLLLQENLGQTRISDNLIRKIILKRKKKSNEKYSSAHN